MSDKTDKVTEAVETLRQAVLSGSVQRCIGGGSWKKCGCYDGPVRTGVYRAKPAPTIRPWTAEEVPSGLEITKPGWVRGIRWGLVAVSSVDITVIDQCGGITSVRLDHLAEPSEWWVQYSTGDPCGVEVQP